MEHRALETWRAAADQAGSGRVLGERLAVVMALAGLLALATAVMVGWQVRSRERKVRLRLGLDGPGPQGPGPGPLSASGSAERPPSGGPSAGPGAPT